VGSSEDQWVLEEGGKTLEGGYKKVSKPRKKELKGGAPNKLDHSMGLSSDRRDRRGTGSPGWRSKLERQANAQRGRVWNKKEWLRTFLCPEREAPEGKGGEKGGWGGRGQKQALTTREQGETKDQGNVGVAKQGSTCGVSLLYGQPRT